MLIDKEAAYKALKQKEEMYGLSFTAEAFGKAARIAEAQMIFDKVKEIGKELTGNAVD